MTQISWSLRILSADGPAASGLSIQLQAFDMGSGWTRLADATTGSDGKIRGKADDGVAKAAVAPMLRLVETADTSVVLGGVPRLSVAASSGTLTADFGDIVRLAEATRPPAPTTSATAKRATLAKPSEERIGGVAAASVAGLAATSATKLRESEARLAERDADLHGVKAERDSLVGRLAETESRLASADARLGESERELGRLRDERDDLAARLTAADARLVDLQAERSGAQAELSDLRLRLASADSDLAASREAAATIGIVGADPIDTSGGITATAISFGDFATKLGSQIDSAQTALKSSGFSLSTVSVSVKTVMQEGSSMVFPETETLRTMRPGALSDVAMTFDPSPTAGQTATSVQVPDIRFLTEGAARRVLASVGLVLEISHGPQGINPDCAPGQAMLQAPAARTSAARGSTVLAIFARAGP